MTVYVDLRSLFSFYIDGDKTSLDQGRSPLNSFDGNHVYSKVIYVWGKRCGAKVISRGLVRVDSWVSCVFVPGESIEKEKKGLS